MDTREVITAYHDANEVYEAASKAKTEAYNAMITAWQTLVDTMTEQGWNVTPYEDLPRYRLEKPKAHGKAREGQAEAALEWLRSIGHGDAVKLSIHYQTLGGIIREELEKGTPIPDCIEVTYEPKLVRVAQTKEVSRG